MDNQATQDLPQIPMLVTFTPPSAGGPTWSFDPPSVDIAAGTSLIVVITLELANGSSGSVSFASSNALQWVSDVPPPNFIGWWLNGPTELDIVDHNLGPNPKGTWDFTLTVTYVDSNNVSTNYTSPDPTIINIEPTGQVLEGVEEVGPFSAEARRLVA